jgi:PAS domain S-box-containing protein
MFQYIFFAYLTSVIQPAGAGFVITSNHISMKFKLITNKHYTNGIKVLLGIIIIILFISVYQSRQVIQTGKWISNTQGILQGSKKILTLALSNESGFRGYILSGRKSFLEPMQKSQKEIYTSLSNLKTLTKNSQAQQIRADSLSFFVSKRIEFSNLAIKSYEENGGDAAIKMVETGEGKLYTDHIRLLVDQIQDAENTSLVKHKEANDKSVKNLQKILLLTMAVVLFLLAVFIQKVRADNVEKSKAAAALKKMNDELEQRVAQRTQELDKKEKLFRALVENNEGIISLIDEKFNVLFRSSSTAIITGRLFEENEKIAITEYLHPEDRPTVMALMAEAVANPGKTIQLSIRVRNKNGYYIWLEGVIINMIPDPAIGGIIINLRDISERKRAEEKIIKANRLYFFISHINQMIVRTRDEATLFKEACQIAVSEGKFRMAWIGMIDEKKKTVIPVMHAGDDSSHPSFINPELLHNNPEYMEPIVSGLCMGKYSVCNDIENDRRMAPWKDEAISRGYRSFMAVPIKISESVVGMFSFYADVKDFFDAAEIALLEEATSDVSFALEVFEKEKLRSKAEAEIKIAVDRYDILARATSDTIWDWDIVNNTMVYNDGINKMFGYKADEVEKIVDWWNEKLHPDDFKKVTELVEDVFEKGLQKFQITYRFRCADDTYKHIFDRAYVMFDESGNPCRMIGAMQDITYQVDEEMRTSKAIIDAQEQERNFIGGELHDNVNQILAGSVLALGMVKGSRAATKESHKYIEMGKGHILNAIEELRKLSHKLAPASFDDNSLKDAFEDLLQTFNVNNQFKIKLNFDSQCNALDGDIHINLYRILQEQIKNIVKYAEATEIEITLTRSGNLVTMKIIDNGKGFNVKAVKNGIGLSNIKKRAESFSGKFILKSSPGKGCEIIVEIPLVV